MKQLIKDNYGIILVSINSTIHELESFLSDLKESDLKDSPKQSLENTLSSYRVLLENLKKDDISDFNEAQIKAILEHRLRILSTQKEKIEATVPHLEEVIKNLTDVSEI